MVNESGRPAVSAATTRPSAAPQYIAAWLLDAIRCALLEKSRGRSVHIAA